MNARFYVPGIGRFASADIIVPDPMNPQSFNRYSYVENNPIIFNDPTGHCKNPSQCEVVGGPDTDGYYTGASPDEYDLYMLLESLTGKDYIGSCLGHGGSQFDCSPSDSQLQRHFSHEYFDLELSLGQAQDLVNELDFFLEVGGAFVNFDEVSGLLGEGIAGLVAHKYGAGPGLALGAGIQIIDWTLGQMQEIRDLLHSEIDIAKDSYSNSTIHFSAGENLTQSWGVVINGNQLNYQTQTNPLTVDYVDKASSTMTLVPGFLQAWYHFDYDEGQ